ncbi:uridine kinase [Geomicrobium sp. JSM 1781026]|uniref:uridine kinase family protein n=1 Tax=Geomicrobium sp. JSM 1781026 TaxID=3344580 RepID=UPI0035C07738
MEKIVRDIMRSINKREGRSVIGISGHGAAGKTTFAEQLVERLGPSVDYLNTDPYIISSAVRKYATIAYEYKGALHQFKMTACHPDAHHTLALERDVVQIREGIPFKTLDTHYMPSTLISSEANVSIVEGMSVAFTNLDLYDMLIYFYTDEATELARRGVRDVSERGRTYEFLDQSHYQRRIQYDLFMHPYREHFDIVIRNSDEDWVVEKHDVR